MSLDGDAAPVGRIASSAAAATTTSAASTESTSVDFLDGGPDKDILIGGYAPESAVDPCVNGEVFTHKGFPDTEPSCGNKKSG
ncbi:MAG: hypothetical protein KDB58_11865 [Solirubrobacterales bacterium]|nr:hypothetical protein [Solirubrobacterales bacterium]MCB8971863.1 hypothetical protein [Thermoleophilales bacterium]MCO5326333.1 hypothetical protein [Solirubrobacterales bacterium]